MQSNNISLQKQWFIMSKQDQDVWSYYDLQKKKKIGAGAYGDVLQVKVKDTNMKRAIKVIKKQRVSHLERLRREVEISSQMDHPNVIKLIEVYEDTQSVYLVQELCEGGELFDKIIQKGHFTESTARHYFRQILLALNYLHTKQIAHRDIKPENFLLLDQTSLSPLKLIDFGLSMQMDSKQSLCRMNTKAGTPYYISPEVLDGEYDLSCDIWSAGVILYILLSGIPPFCGKTDKQILDKVRAGQYSFDLPEFQVVSQEAKDLISQCLTTPQHRISAGQALQHPWIRSQQEGKAGLKVNMARLKGFQSSTRLRKAVLTFIASQLNESEIKEIGEEFRRLDLNNDGELSIQEVQAGLKERLTQGQVQELLSSLDTDGSGTINYTEFIAAMMDNSIYMKQDKLRQAFRMFDLDGNGKISGEELASILGSHEEYRFVDASFFKDMLNENDKNGDGQIDYHEFISMMNIR